MGTGFRSGRCAEHFLVASYILRDIDAELWRKVKAKAATEGISVKAAIESLLKGWAG